MNKKLISIFPFLIALLFTQVVFADFGDVVKTFRSPAVEPTGIVWANEHLWQLDRRNGRMIEIDPETGRRLKTLITPGYFPAGIAWDGKYFWISDIGTSDDGTGSIFVVNPTNGLVVKRLDSPVQWPTGLCWDGKSLWISDDRHDQIVQVDPVDATILNRFTSPHRNPTGMAWDGNFLWIGDRGKDKIYLVDPKRGEVIFDIDAPGPYVYGLAWDGSNIWCNDYQLKKVFCLKANDKKPYTLTKPRREHITMTTDVRVLGPGMVRDGQVFLALPEEAPTQHFLSPIKFNRKPTSIPSDKWGQKVALFEYSGLKAGESMRFQWSADVALRGIRWKIFPTKIGTEKDIPDKVKKIYLADGDKYKIYDPYIQRLVSRITKGETNLYWKARKLFDFVIKKLGYKRTGGWDTAPRVLQRGSGSCSEYSFSYIALCRAAGIPARYVGAIVVRGDDASLDWVFHRWTEIYLPPYGWIPVDPNHGDKVLPADQANGFGCTDNVVLVTTRCGGYSKYLEWGYDGFDRKVVTPRCRVSVDMIAAWEPLMKKGKDETAE